MDRTRIQTARHEAGITQRKLADAVGVSQRHISGVERYDAAPSVWLAQRIARTLGVGVEDLWIVDDDA